MHNPGICRRWPRLNTPRCQRSRLWRCRKGSSWSQRLQPRRSEKSSFHQQVRNCARISVSNSPGARSNQLLAGRTRREERGMTRYAKVVQAGQSCRQLAREICERPKFRVVHCWRHHLFGSRRLWSRRHLMRRAEAPELPHLRLQTQRWL